MTTIEDIQNAVDSTMAADLAAQEAKRRLWELRAAYCSEAPDMVIRITRDDALLDKRFPLRIGIPVMVDAEHNGIAQAHDPETATLEWTFRGRESLEIIKRGYPRDAGPCVVQIEEVRR